MGLTLCNYEAQAEKTDHKHREDVYCHRCIKRERELLADGMDPANIIDCSTRESEALHRTLREA